MIKTLSHPVKNAQSVGILRVNSHMLKNKHQLVFFLTIEK